MKTTATTLYTSLTLLTTVNGATSPTTNTRGGMMTTTPAAARRRLDMEGAVTDIGYDSYATSWRYLGAYLDCRSSSSSGFSSFTSKFSSMCTYCHRHRDLKKAGCKNPTRRLLWAAYYDPSYSGNQIGEYQYYDSDDGAWDDSTCTRGNCKKMDCHNPHSSTWKLLGVYKESVSFDDDNFYEQLFKHQGYCLWDGDKDGYSYNSHDSGDGNDNDYSESTYGFMQTMRKELPEGCTKVSNVFPDGNTYYVDMKPQSGGDMTLGVYKDSGCTEESKYDYEDYQSYAASSLTASGVSGAFDTWNSGMDAYKICQPCRAYNTEETQMDGNWEWDRRQRGLGEENDGQGDEEQNGFNCYDDAGYQNCNQCYKFETHTDMQEASAADLHAASAQGTILRIQYEGQWYGNGNVGDSSSSGSSNGGEYSSHGFQYSSSYTFQYRRTSYSFAGFALVAVGGAAVRVQRRRRQRGTLDGDVEEVNDGEDASSYVEMAETR